MARQPLSVVVTTLNNAQTLERCLASVDWADEIVVLDSGSTDATHEIALRHRARWSVQPFAGYGPQKFAAVMLATHRWVLLLDADECVPAAARSAIETALMAPRVAGFALPRREQVFWRMQHAWVRHSAMLRLFDRTQVYFDDDPIHAAPHTHGMVQALSAWFEHYGEPDIAAKVAKINHYSSGMVAAKLARGQRFARLRMLFYPSWQFFRAYVLKRKFLSGWAGYIGARVEAFYAFLKYAKLYEARRRDTTRRR